MAEKNIIQVIDKLIERGKEFTFKTYTDRKDSEIWGGEPNSAWVIWIKNIKTLLDKTTQKNSAPIIYYNTALKIPLNGYDINNFEDAKANYLKSLNIMKDLIIDGDSFDELLDKAILSDNSKSSSQEKTTVISGKTNSKKVFIVHGHDHNLKADLEVFLLRLNLEPIVLHREVDNGQTIIEKFENNSDVSYVFILLTPDEIAYTIDQHEKDDNVRNKEFRARPNVIFEFGFFIGKLGRKKVCALHKGNVSLPSDLSGVIYKKVEASIDDIGFSLIMELKAAGLTISI